MCFTLPVFATINQDSQFLYSIQTNILSETILDANSPQAAIANPTLKNHIRERYNLVEYLLTFRNVMNTYSMVGWAKRTNVSRYDHHG